MVLMKVVDSNKEGVFNSVVSSANMTTRETAASCFQFICKVRTFCPDICHFFNLWENGSQFHFQTNVVQHDIQHGLG